MKTVLYVKLPCEKIYPGGLTYIADYVHKRNPEVQQTIFDLSLIPTKSQKSRFIEEIAKTNPDIIAFSWRNIQTFSPHDGTPSLEAIFKFDHSSAIVDKLDSIYLAGRSFSDFIYQIYRNKSFIALAKKTQKEATIVVGGTAISCFPERLIKRFPEDVIAVIGEGERTMLKIIEEQPLDKENIIFRKNGQITRYHSTEDLPLEESTAVDYDYIAKIYPDFYKFRSEYIGIQTKRGCSFNCSFCMYNIIEGKRERYRKPQEIVDEVSNLVNNHGYKHVWFTDAQFVASKRSVAYVEETLDLLIEKNLDLAWTGYVRLENITANLAKKMLLSGIDSFNLTFIGSQKVIEELHLGYKLERQLEAFQMIKDAGHTNQMIQLYLPLNSPGETIDTLLETIAHCRDLYKLFGRENIHPWIFFLGVQNGTPLESSLIETGYLKEGYNPLSYNPLTIKKLLYNPQPFGRIIGQAFLEAKRQAVEEDIGRMTLEILEEKLLAEDLSLYPRSEAA